MLEWASMLMGKPGRHSFHLQETAKLIFQLFGLRIILGDMKILISRIFFFLSGSMCLGIIQPIEKICSEFIALSILSLSNPVLNKDVFLH